MKPRGWCPVVFAAIIAGGACAAPFQPARDDVVLETLPFRPTDPGVRRLQVLHAQLAMQPGNLAIAVELARRYVELGRVTGDPRYAGYAQAALAPWWSAPDPPRDVLMLRATLHQRVHRFDDALADLRLALERNPRDAQARLTRATVLQVRGEFEAARRDCVALQTTVHELIAVACLANVDGNTGGLHSAYRGLRSALTHTPIADPGVRVWVLTGLAEMASRAGLFEDADAHFKAALAADASDQYLLAAYADYLLDRGRASEAATLVKDHTQADGLLLRYALALQRQRLPDASQRIAELRARFDASRLRGDRVHLREEARFALDLARDPKTALALAKENWTVQKEPADARVLLDAARAAGDRVSIDAIARWIEKTHLEDVHLVAAHPSG
jgi:tetratricopeptide (TPR) repeat protein